MEGGGYCFNPLSRIHTLLTRSDFFDRSPGHHGFNPLSRIHTLLTSSSSARLTHVAVSFQSPVEDSYPADYDDPENIRSSSSGLNPLSRIHTLLTIAHGRALCSNPRT